MGVVASSALALVFFVMCAWMITVHYGLGVIRGSLDEGARAGAWAGHQNETCERVAGEAIAQLLGGPLAEGSSPRCWSVGTQMVAEASGSFEAWLPGVPSWSFTLRASSSLEP